MKEVFVVYSSGDSVLSIHSTEDGAKAEKQRYEDKYGIGFKTGSLPLKR